MQCVFHFSKLLSLFFRLSNTRKQILVHRSVMVMSPCPKFEVSPARSVSQKLKQPLCSFWRSNETGFVNTRKTDFSHVFYDFCLLKLILMTIEARIFLHRIIFLKLFYRLNVIKTFTISALCFCQLTLLCRAKKKKHTMNSPMGPQKIT